MEKLGNYNKITTTAVVTRTQDTDLFHYKSNGIEEGEKLSLTEFFNELDNFFNFLETEPQTKSIVLNNAIYKGSLGKYVEWLHETMLEYDVTERGIDVELDEERFLEQHEEEMEDLKERSRQ